MLKSTISSAQDLEFDNGKPAMALSKLFQSFVYNVALHYHVLIFGFFDWFVSLVWVFTIRQSHAVVVVVVLLV